MVNYWCNYHKLTITKNKVENVCLLKCCTQLSKQRNTKRVMGAKSYYNHARGPVKSYVAGRSKS